MQRILAVSLVCSVLAASAAAAPVLGDRHAEGPGLAYSMLSARFDDDQGQGVLDGVHLLTAALSNGEGRLLEIVVPRLSVRGPVYDAFEYPEDVAWDRDGYLGNIYVGAVQADPHTEGAYLRYGVTLPTASQLDLWDATIDSYTDLHHFERFASDLVALHGGVGRTLGFEGGSLRFELDQDVLIPTDGNGRDKEFKMRYGAVAVSDLDAVILSLELAGTWWITADEGADHTYHQATLGAALPLGRVRPSLSFGVPLGGIIADEVRGFVLARVDVLFD